MVYNMLYHIWLVVYLPTPVKNDGVSWDKMTFPTEWKNIPNVPKPPTSLLLGEKRQLLKHPKNWRCFQCSASSGGLKFWDLHCSNIMESGVSVNRGTPLSLDGFC